MAERVRQVDVAKAAGVSQSVVSTVLGSWSGQRLNVSEETTERVKRIAQELGYLPNSTAQQLRNRKSKLIGVLVESGAPPIIAHRIAALEREAALADYRVVIAQMSNDLERLQDYITDFVSRGLDGLVCLHHETRQSNDLIPNLVQQIEHVVYMRKPAIEGSSYVHIDAADGIHQAMDYLKQQGRKRIGMVLLDDYHQFNLDRRQAYIESCDRLGLNMDHNLIWTADATLGPRVHEADYDLAHQVSRHLVIEHGADAIIAINDFWAAQLIKSVIKRGLLVPEDVSIIGQGNLAIAQAFMPEITTLDPQNEAFAKAAMMLLLEQLNDNHGCTSVLSVKPQLVIRASA